MGTRGLIKIICKKRIMYSYNSCDSYHFGLGRDLVMEIISIINEHGLKWFIKHVSKIEYISYPKTTSNKRKPYTQGSIKEMIKAGYIYDMGYREPITNDIEYLYVIDLDKKYFYLDGCEKFSIESLPKNLYSMEWCDENFKTVSQTTG